MLVLDKIAELMTCSSFTTNLLGISWASKALTTPLWPQVKSKLRLPINALHNRLSINLGEPCQLPRTSGSFLTCVLQPLLTSNLFSHVPSILPPEFYPSSNSFLSHVHTALAPSEFLQQLFFVIEHFHCLLFECVFFCLVHVYILSSQMDQNFGEVGTLFYNSFIYLKAQ